MLDSEKAIKETVKRAVCKATTGEAPEPHRDALQKVIGKGVAASLAIARGERINDHSAECLEATFGITTEKLSSEDREALNHVSAVVDNCFRR